MNKGIKCLVLFVAVHLLAATFFARIVQAGQDVTDKTQNISITQDDLLKDCDKLRNEADSLVLNVKTRFGNEWMSRKLDLARYQDILDTWKTILDKKVEMFEMLTSLTISEMFCKTGECGKKMRNAKVEIHKDYANLNYWDEKCRMTLLKYDKSGKSILGSED